MSQEQPRREEAEQEHKSIKDVQESSLARKKAVAESIGGQVLNLILFFFLTRVLHVYSIS